MPMKVEAAIVTQKRPSAVYNTDSVNVNGKVMPREVIRNGYKGSGVISGSSYFVLTSSDVEGFADASVTAFNERAELFSRSREPMNVFSGFFEDCRGALLNMNRSADELVGAGFYARGRKAVIAHNGQTKIYLQRLGVTSPVTAEKITDTTADFSGVTFSDVCEGDIFILLSPGAAGVLGDKEIEDILRISDGSVKRVVNYILKVALAADGKKAVSAIVVKVLETALEEEIVIPAFEPEFDGNKQDKAVPQEEKAEAESETAEEAVEAAVEAEEAETEVAAEEAEAVVLTEAEAQTEAEEAAVENEDISSVFAKNALEMFESTDIIGEADVKNDAELYTEEIEEIPEEPVEDDVQGESEASEKSDSKKSRTPLFVILGIMFAVSIALIFALAVMPAFSDKGEETTVEETTTEEESTEEESTEEESSDEEETEEETEEEATEEKTTAEETTTRKPAEETTTRKPAAESTTAAPVVAPEQTTAAVETTAEAEEATTAEEVTAPSEATTAAPEVEPTTAEAITEAATEAATEAVAEASDEAEEVL